MTILQQIGAAVGRALKNFARRDLSNVPIEAIVARIPGSFGASTYTAVNRAADGTLSADVLSVAGKTGAVTLTGGDVGLGNVENKSSATIRGELTSGNVTSALGFTPEDAAKKNVANGYAGLGADGKVAASQLPAIAVTDTFVVASQAAMLALTAEVGDVAVRTDLNKSFILKTAGASTLANWQELLTPADSVTSVNGMTGAVTVTTITGNAGTATKLQTARTISLGGDASGSASFDGSGDVTITVTVADNSHNHSAATGTTAGFMSAADKTKLDGIATGANAYVHPTTDGSHHVPATGTTNDKKVLKSGATAGSEAWGNVDYSELTGVPATFAPSAHGHSIGDLTGVQATITGAASSVTSSNLTASMAMVTDASGKIAAHGTVSATELGYLDGVTSAVQTQLNGKQATLTGAATTIASSNLTASMALVSDASGKVAAHGTVSSTELGYLDGVTSAIQSQIDGKQATLTGAATTIASSNLTASMALVSDASGKVAAHGTVSAAELGYLDGVTSAIQTQLNGKQASLGFTPENVANKDVANGYAGLDASGKISSSALPAIAVTDTFVVATQAAMLALTAEVGDVAVRTDLNKSFILKTAGASVLANWQELLTPTDTVLSVAGKTGAVTLAVADVSGAQATITGAASTVTSSDLTASMAMVTDANGKIAAHGTVSATELGYLDGVTSAIQTQLNGKQATLTGAATTIASSNLTASMALVSDASGKVAAHGTVSSTELGYLDGVTSAIQTQIDGKQATLTGAATSIASSNLAASMAMVTDASGKVAAHGTVTATELGYLDGVTSAIQTQLNGKAASSHTHTGTDFVNFAYKDGVVAATTAALTATYANGSSGVGATLTNSGTLAALSIDGAVLAANDRVLVKDQASALQNGIYVVTNVGSASVAWVMTRSADADTPIEMAGAIVPVDKGTVNGSKLFTNTFKSTDVIGTTACAWYEVAMLGGSVSASMALVSDASGRITSHASVSATELGYLDGVTSAVQTQLNGKQATLTGAATSIASSNLTASMALVSDSSGKVAAHGTVSATELGYLDGVTSAVQTQIDAKLAASGGTATNLQLNAAKVRQATDQSAGSGTVTLNYSNGDYFKVTASGNITLALSNMPASAVSAVILEAINFGGRTITWPTGVRWAGGIAPVGLTSSGRDMIVFMKDSAGSTYGFVLGKDVK